MRGRMHRMLGLTTVLLALGVTLLSSTALATNKSAGNKNIVLQKYRVAARALAKMQEQKDQFSDVQDFERRVAEGEQSLKRAQAFLAEEDYTQADVAISQFLRAVSLGDSTKQSDARRKVYQELLAAVGSLWGIYQVETGKTGEQDAIGEADFDAVVKQSEQLAAAEDYKAATANLQEIYQTIVQQLSARQHQQTVVYSLDFATPEEEYHYELRRYAGYRKLLELKRSSSPQGGSEGKLIDKSLAEGERLSQQARAEGKKGNFKESIALLEQSIKQLAPALRMMGLMVP